MVVIHAFIATLLAIVCGMYCGGKRPECRHIELDRASAEALRDMQGVVGGKPNWFSLMGFLEVQEEMGHEYR